MICWQNVYIKVLRILIDDNGTSPTFTDTRLEDVLVVAAAQVVEEARIDTYTITITPPDITPTPLTDDAFRNLVTLKGACIIDRGALRLAAAVAGLEAKCGPVAMKVNRRVEGFATLIEKGYCAAYEQAIRQYVFGNLDFAVAILSPFINEDFDPSHYSKSYIDPRVK